MVSIRLEESPTIAHRTITLCDISNRPVHHREAIQSPVLGIAHLAYAVMGSILGIYSPVAFLSNKAMKALILLIIDNPGMCIELK